VIEIILPPLRARLGDVPQLADHFLERAAGRQHQPVKVLSDEAIRSLLAYSFPGNVRELENMIERAVVNAGPAVAVLTPAHIFGDKAQSTSDDARPTTFSDLPLKDAVAALEREMISRALEASNGNRAEAARRLGINRRLLYSKLDEYGIR
jgi:DNA-binding NtrC family response regulator